MVSLWLEIQVLTKWDITLGPNSPFTFLLTYKHFVIACGKILISPFAAEELWIENTLLGSPEESQIYVVERKYNISN